MSTSEHLPATVLVADDEEVVRNVAKLALERSGFSVILASDGQQAVDLFKSHAGAVDAVLADMTMPGMDGAQICEAVHRIQAGIPILLSSGFGASEAMQSCQQGGPVSFLPKPYRPKELVDTLREVIARVRSV